MKTTITFCFCIITLFAFGFANAAIFKCVAPSGQVIYSNVMGEGCVKLLLDWEEIAESSDGSKFYVDPDTIRKNGHRVKVWELVDSKTVAYSKSDKPSYLSIKLQHEYDCKEEQYRSLALSYHSGNMGSGKVSDSDADTTKWEPVPPRSMAETMWKFACGIK